MFDRYINRRAFPYRCIYYARSHHSQHGINRHLRIDTRAVSHHAMSAYYNHLSAVRTHRLIKRTHRHTRDVTCHVQRPVYCAAAAEGDGFGDVIVDVDLMRSSTCPTPHCYSHDRTACYTGRRRRTIERTGSIWKFRADAAFTSLCDTAGRMFVHCRCMKSYALV